MKTNQIIIAAVILVLLANLRIVVLDTPLFHLFNHPITLSHLIIFGFLVWLSNKLSSPFREIIALFLVIWLVSLTGIFAFISYFANILILIVVVVLILSIL